MYLSSAMQTMAEVFSYVDNKKDADILFENFISSGIALQFGNGNPYYINMPSNVLFKEIVKDKLTIKKPLFNSKSKEYWCGFVLAYYQWYSAMKFEEIGKYLPPSKIITMYHPLHEASLEKFVEVANYSTFQKETNLTKYRKNANMSQQQLAKYSNVSLRSIQLYEQRQLDINVAKAINLYQLSKALCCNMEDLLEHNTK